MKKNYPCTKKNLQIKTWILAFLLVLITRGAVAQLVGWSNKDGIKITEHAGTQQLNYQVLLNINTAALIGAGKMQATGADIRFSKDCAGATLLNYFIETGINTANTQIWVELDTLKANGNYGLYMWYGNATATAASNFNNTFPLSTQLVVPSGTVTLSGTNNYSWFEIASGAGVIITPNSPFVINARKIKITGTLNGNGGGYLGGQTSQNGGGPGGGKPGSILTPGNTSGGGGAYGGNGGNGTAAFGTNGDGGIAYGNSTTIDMGSGGGGPVGGGAGATDGNGGAGVTFNARVVEITGAININGNIGTSINGAGYGGGGGAGGGFLLHAYTTLLSGTISANGAKGGNGAGGGGGGGGGRINLYSETAFAPGTYNVAAGLQGVTSNTNNAVGSPGMPGAVATGTISMNEPTYVLLPHIVLTAGNSTICQGTAASFTASTGFAPYDFHVNSASVQNTASNTFNSSTLNNSDTVRVLGIDANGCVDTSNSIMIMVNPSPTVSINPTSVVYCQGGSAGLTASGATTYTWSPPAGLNTTSGAMVTSNATVTTQYTVMATDNNGCTDMDTVTVTVNNCTGINAHSSNTLHVYPNPFQNTLVLQGDLAGANAIEIRNVIGETVISLDNSFLSAGKKEINVSALQPGIYFLLVKTNDGSQLKKLIKN